MGILLAVVVALIGITLIAVDIISRIIDVQVSIVQMRLEISIKNSVTKLEQTKLYNVLSWLNILNHEEGN